jgi:hypothetical protein
LEAFVFGEVNGRTTEEFKRKLTAIYSADVAGYRWLVGEDEAGTVKTLTSRFN